MVSIRFVCTLRRTHGPQCGALTDNGGFSGATDGRGEGTLRLGQAPLLSVSAFSASLGELTPVGCKEALSVPVL